MVTAQRRRALATSVPPHAYFVVSAVFHYLGPAFAVLLFARVDVLGVAWLRIASAALIFAVWRRPWRRAARARSPRAGGLLAWGATLAAMNAASTSRSTGCPLGTVAAIEFLPVVVLAALGARTPRNVAALALAVPASTAHRRPARAASRSASRFAFANAVLFALYIVLADRVGQATRRSAASTAWRAAMLVAAVVVTPIGGWAAVPALSDRRARSPASASASPPRSSPTSPTSSRSRAWRARPTR